jgi:guanylate kinase
MSEGLLIVLSGPSGVGKGTVCQALRRCTPELVYSVSATTRKPRAGEQEGVNYFFKTREEFQRMIERDELLEWAEYVGNYYGTPAEFVRRTLAEGRDILLEIDVQGAMKVREKMPDGVFVFLVPPSYEELRKRIAGRGTETPDAIRERLNAAQSEIGLMQHYDYIVVNDSVESACDRIRAIISAEHCRRDRMMRTWVQSLNRFEEVK